MVVRVVGRIMRHYSATASQESERATSGTRGHERGTGGMIADK